MAVQLVTDQLSTTLDDKFRTELIGNFKAIEKALNQLEKLDEEIRNDFDIDKNDHSQLDTLKGELVARINRIVLGTDDTAIRAVVDEVLREKGVIR